MTTLSVIWWATASFAVLTVVALAGIVVSRLRSMYMNRVRLRQRRRADIFISDWLSSGGRADDMSLSRIPEWIVLEAAASHLQRDRRAAVSLNALVGTLVERAHSRLLSVRDRRRRLKTVYLLASFKSPQSVRFLRTVMACDPDRDLRLAAAKALAHMEALPRIDHAIERLGVMDGEGSRVLHGIFRMLPSERRWELLALTKPQAPVVIRLLAIDALGRSEDLSLARSIEKTLDSESVEIKAAALRALGRLGAASSRSPILRALADPAWEVRCQAAYCVGRLKITMAAPALALLMGDPYWWVRFRAAEALRAIGPDGHRYLAEAAQAGGAARDVAEMVLAERLAA